MSANPVLLVAKSEFSNVVRNPMVIATVAMIVLLVMLNAAGSSHLLPQLKMMGYQEVFVQAWSNTYYYTLLIISLLSLGVGILSVSGERSNGSLRMLLTKPLYRRDIIMGKMIGVMAFLLLLNLFVGILNIALIMINYGGPSSTNELLKIGLFEMVMFIFSSLTFGIMLLFSLIVTGLLESLVFALAYLYLTWYVFVPDSLGILRWINPVLQCHNAITPWATIPAWVNASLPVVVLMIIELAAVLFANIMLFNREEI